jgi:hypothetical protein
MTFHLKLIIMFQNTLAFLNEVFISKFDEYSFSNFNNSKGNVTNLKFEVAQIKLTIWTVVFEKDLSTIHPSTLN